MASPAADGADGWPFVCRSYGRHSLQRVAVWQPAQGRVAKPGQWIIYIHGGAWRDPRITWEAIRPCLQHLLATPPQLSESAIRGFASIDYRLSAHPDFPQDPATTPGFELRQARHPDHLLDLYAAIALLATEYRLADGYLLVGHSAGATLAFQLLMGAQALAGQPVPQPIPLPAAVVGVAGIYDLVGLNARHRGRYADFMRAAFGSDEAAWRAASPATSPRSFRGSWRGPGYALLAWSPQDSLVDGPEMEAMAAKLERDGIETSMERNLTGEHDDVWKEGSQMAQLVRQALEHLSSRGPEMMH